jgi:sugar lactone lactonase YvrE
MRENRRNLAALGLSLVALGLLPGAHLDRSGRALAVSPREEGNCFRTDPPTSAEGSDTRRGRDDENFLQLTTPPRLQSSRALAKVDTRVPEMPHRRPVFARGASPERPGSAWSLTEGIAAPAGVLYDPQTHELYVSQIGGQGDKKDGDGVISRLDLDGHILKVSWVYGLNAPKGLALTGRTLWVSDIDELVSIDVAAGKVTRKIAVEGAKFLTGIAVDARGSLYVADMLTSRVYIVEHGRARVFIEGPSLESPGALLKAGDQLVVGAWGFTTDYSTRVPGSIYAIDVNDRKQTTLSLAPRGNWFGLCSDGDQGYFAADFGSGRVCHLDNFRKAGWELSLPPGCAGLTYVPHARLLVVTETRDNRVSGYILAPGTRPK